MRNEHGLVFSVAALTALAIASTASASDWGSFDTSRINYDAGTLNGSAHTTLQGIITSNGGTIVAPTPTLTAAYLNGVDVFYTSLLDTNTGALSGAEQTALQNWIAGGGTLIVTADIFPLAAYESFTSFYGVTNYFNIGNNQTGNVVAGHAITTGVTTYRYNTNSTYIYGADALLLGNDGSGNDFLIVMEPGTGFGAGGRIVVLGDHNMFANSHIADNDNTQLAANIAQWTKEVSCPWDLDGGGFVGAGDLLLLLASWGNPYGASDLLDLLAAWGACPGAAECKGQVCGEYTFDCNPNNPDCVCYTSPNGAFCGPGVGCDAEPCDADGDCPPGFRCAILTCCGDEGICIPECDAGIAVPDIPAGVRTSTGR